MTETTLHADDADQPRWWSRALLIGAVIAAALLLVGALGTKFGIWQFGLGLMLASGATLLAVIGVVGGLFGWFVARRKNLPTDRRLSMLGMILSGLIVAVMGMQANTAFTVPQIHNISTDLNDPPAFNVIVGLRGEESNPLEYDVAKLAPVQGPAYPFVKPLVTGLDRDAAFARSVEVLEGMGLEIVAADADARVVEATFTSFWFGFKDDVVVRIRPVANGGDGSVVDLRSVSRVGQSDLGANARRIGKFIDKFNAG